MNKGGYRWRFSTGRKLDFVASLVGEKGFEAAAGGERVSVASEEFGEETDVNSTLMVMVMGFGEEGCAIVCRSCCCCCCISQTAAAE